MYRGKNQDYYISGEILSSILNRHGRGGIPRVSSKGLLFYVTAPVTSIYMAR